MEYDKGTRATAMKNDSRLTALPSCGVNHPLHVLRTAQLQLSRWGCAR